MKLKLRERDTIETAYAEYASGPGWSNTPLWVIIRDGNGELRQECLQPIEFNAEIHQLYKIAAAIQEAMTGAVRRHLSRRTRKR